MKRQLKQKFFLNHKASVTLYEHNYVLFKRYSIVERDEAGTDQFVWNMRRKADAEFFFETFKSESNNEYA